MKNVEKNIKKTLKTYLNKKRKKAFITTMEVTANSRRKYLPIKLKDLKKLKSV